jgi:hypothetical protein
MMRRLAKWILEDELDLIGKRAKEREMEVRELQRALHEATDSIGVLMGERRGHDAARTVKLDPGMTMNQIETAVQEAGSSALLVRSLIALCDLQWVEALNQAVADDATERQIQKRHGEAEGLMVLKGKVLQLCAPREGMGEGKKKG